MKIKKSYVILSLLTILLLLLNKLIHLDRFRHIVNVLKPNPSTIEFSSLIIFCVISGCIYLTFLICKKQLKFEYCLLFMNSLALTNFVVHITKLFIKRKRPDWENEKLPDESFPSGHTALAMSWAFFMIIIPRRTEIHTIDSNKETIDNKTEINNEESNQSIVKIKENKQEKKGNFAVHDQIHSKVSFGKPFKLDFLVLIITFASIFLSISVGVSRYLDKKHFISDIIAGGLYGMGISIFLRKVYRKCFHRNSRFYL